MNQLQLSLEEKTAELRTSRLEVDMLSQKVRLRAYLKRSLCRLDASILSLLGQLTVHKDEFSRLETTSSTKIAQLEAALDLEVRQTRDWL
jgi:hypothetical protein